MGFFRQEYWIGLPFPHPEALPDPRTEPASPELSGRFFTTELPGEPVLKYKTIASASLPNVVRFRGWEEQQTWQTYSKWLFMADLKFKFSWLSSNPFLLLPSIFPSIRVFFPMSWLFTSGDQNIIRSVQRFGRNWVTEHHHLATPHPHVHLFSTTGHDWLWSERALLSRD